MNHADNTATAPAPAPQAVTAPATPAAMAAAAAPPTTQPSAPSAIPGIRRGRMNVPSIITLYGMEGVGKTTLASQTEKPIFLCPDTGTERFEIDRLPEVTHWRNAPPDAHGIQRDVFSQLDLLLHKPHDYKTFVVDTLDWLEPILYRHVCLSDPDGIHKNKGSIVLAYKGYGKGFEVALDEWRAFLDKLLQLRTERRMDILLLAHAHVKTFKNPEGDDYDRYMLKMNEKGAGLFKEKSDAVLFAHQTIVAAKRSSSGDDDKRRYGIDDPSNPNIRYLFTTRRAAWDAKNRMAMPDRVPMLWSEVMKYTAVKTSEEIDAMIALAKEQIGFIAAPLQPDANAALERVGRDPSKLLALINFIRDKQG